MNTSLETFRYDDRIVRKFLLATMLWGVVAMLIGVILATQLVVQKANLGPWFTFGRLRPLHTNAAIFAFVGNAIFCGVYYSTQRLCKARMWSDTLSAINFWGWQLIIVSAAISLPLGYTTSKEYAELEWPIDIAITFVWVVFGLNLIMTLVKRRERHMYVAIWFYIATFVTVAVLHLVNSFELPVGFMKSYPFYAGVQDAFVQWWYGHNAVAFFLTTPMLGIMYYFLPKAAERPVFSYRLSIVHFWSLVFIYIWAGPHHLHYTALADWASTLGMVFSVMLLAPSWGGMINGLLTLRGAWHKVAEDPILKFFVIAVTAYGMSTFEGPLLSIKSVNALSHYTDWTIGHVHSGVLGWNGFLIFGMIYWLVPRLWKTELYSRSLANLHFWLSTCGIVLYVVSMWVAGITQGLMWKAFRPDGRLMYDNFLETVIKLLPMYWLRLAGGLMYLGGTLIMVYVLWKTIAKAPKNIPDTEAQAMAPTWKNSRTQDKSTFWHRRLEAMPLTFTVLALLSTLIATAFEFVPAFLIKGRIPVSSAVAPYTPLELEGRDIYIREGCNVCHSQMVRPFRSETVRYGPYSRAEEFVYDHPFLWGSKRTGPDLHRVGGKYNHLWHLRHMENPESTSKGSIMPPYPWLLTDDLDTSLTRAKVRGMQRLGVPYSDEQVKNADQLRDEQAALISKELKEQGAEREFADKEIVALIAYLQRLGTDLTKHKDVEVEAIE